MGRPISEVAEYWLNELKFKNSDQYLDWCRQKSLPITIYKTSAQLKKEVKLRKSSLAEEVLSRKTIGTEKALKMICSGADLSEIKGWKEQELFNSVFKDKWTNPNFRAFILFVYKETDLLERVNNREMDSVRALINIFYYEIFWVKKYADWKATSHNPSKQLSSLLRYLFAEYDVPLFMDKAWTDAVTNHNYIDWFIHIGSGKNIRKAFRLPIPLTKKAAHHFLKAPQEYTIPGAILYGVVKAEGGEDHLAKALSTGRLINFFSKVCYEKDINFVMSAIRFFVRNPMLDLSQVDPILDYVWDVKYTTTRVHENNEYVDRPPLQPDFDFSNRSVQALLEQVERWHRILNREQKHKGRASSWSSIGIKGFYFEEGYMSKPSFKIWRIEELLNQDQLRQEGRTLHHCVVSYGHSCASGRTSIFSLSCESLGVRERCLTLEVTKERRIVQIRGSYNRPSKPKESQILSRWANKEELTFNYGG